ncbi:Serine/threonine protein kinase [Parasponia andersonii]|uniref:dual-specificity kinase n=1 Tax=Parasponia andersonii TaxID=3476 RepID=A0A2P5DT75_PARAD|nr:Serine/threonine protein kinase [Parasponia andersonii]
MVAVGIARIEKVEEEQRRRTTRKRPRSAWDVGPSQPEAQRALIPGNEGLGIARHASPPKRDDDRDGHYVFSLGENLTSRYKILSKMGEGTFGRVLECWDRQTREYVAIKVVRSIRKYRDAAMIEVDILEHLAKDEKGCSRYEYILVLADSTVISLALGSKVFPAFFVQLRANSKLVFEKLGPSLFDFLKRNKYHPFPVDLVREFGRQLLESVAYMHDLCLIHTDLKPENILLVSSEYVKLPGYKRVSTEEMQYRFLPKSSAIKLIDFGSTTYDNQNHSSIVSTRHYRAPEVILGLGWSYPCDMWSLGCILVELCSGDALFQTHENLEHLAMMERVLGPLPEHMIQRANRGAEKYFKRGTRLNWPEGAVSRESIRAVKKLDCLKELVSQHVESSRSSLIDLLHGLLKYDPSERLTARQALDHPFFRNST